MKFHVTKYKIMRIKGHIKLSTFHSEFDNFQILKENDRI